MKSVIRGGSVTNCIVSVEASEESHRPQIHYRSAGCLILTLCERCSQCSGTWAAKQLFVQYTIFRKRMLRHVLPTDRLLQE